MAKWQADAWPGPSLVIAYSTCIAHGIDMSKSMSHQKDAVKSGYWPLYRFQPTEVDGVPAFRGIKVGTTLCSLTDVLSVRRIYRVVVVGAGATPLATGPARSDASQAALAAPAA